MSELKERIKSLRENLRMSQTEFGESLGAGIGVIKNLESGITTLKPAMADLICRLHNVDPIWLETGEGEMFRKKTPHIKENYDQFNSYCGDVKDENGKSINYLEAALRNPSIFTIPLDDLKQKVRLLIAAENYTYDEALQNV